MFAHLRPAIWAGWPNHRLCANPRASYFRSVYGAIVTLSVEALGIPEVKLITPPRFADARGYFSETFNSANFAAAGIDCNFIQDNQSGSVLVGTIRGLHYQAPPFAQSKLVRVLAGAIIDVAVDVRRGSPTYGQWVKATLTAESGTQIFVPKGFLHGFVTLAPDTVVAYKVDAPYSREHDGSVRWNDPDLAIDWELDGRLPVLSEKDEAAPLMTDFDTPFTV
ncbi:dTDP-4-dehydrorhamnose 3,5-epimerase [Hyphomonas adhaerens MHS-3]|uniref:dTDP-4-dehydrorhamnose 3,5-epimerase n=1 Tax=Hyphomonas adhaerens MHS-3 TaxID=1280949 RepID=A0A069E616_9PROT|nr:dTDP-4-dehydrorhamnose 3,5-epimerase [Hyphomonas adhaerens MHS-3]